jgi:signal transduction histidine kinase
MNPISAFFVRNIIVVFFFYGLAFFVMGVALLLASRRQSSFRFVQAIRPLAAFGILHGLHEWYEMYQKYAALTGGYIPALWEEMVRLGTLAASFVALILFGVALLNHHDEGGRGQRYLPVAGMLLLWGVGIGLVAQRFEATSMDLIAVGDVLARYGLGIPGALLGTWALMAQQRTFREHNMAQFGRDLVWCATALFLFGVVGQIFVRPTLLVPTQILNSTLFLQWFGIPVQLFRGLMAVVMTFYMVHALNAFEVENQRRLEQALGAERRNRQEVERLNGELRLTAQELALMLNLSNDLSAALALPQRLNSALRDVVSNLIFPNAGMILLREREGQGVSVRAVTGFGDPVENARYALAQDLGEMAIAQARPICQHEDGQVITLSLDGPRPDLACREYSYPTVCLALPLQSGEQVTGSLVLANLTQNPHPVSVEEFQLVVGIARQLSLSIENARLTWRAQRHEKLLAQLLDQVVDAQEGERQRIARELHDATGQSLTAISLGLRGIGRLVEREAPAITAQLREVESYSASALTDLRRIIADLRPSQLDDLGLVAALRWYVQSFEQRHGVRATFHTQGDPDRLPSETETVLFRIVQEALTNVAKHAQASQVTVSMETQPQGVQVTIADDGQGFDARYVLNRERYGHAEEEGREAPSLSGWGLVGMQERTRLLGGECTIESTPGEGSRIQVRIPLGEGQG